MHTIDIGGLASELSQSDDLLLNVSIFVDKNGWSIPFWVSFDT